MEQLETQLYPFVQVLKWVHVTIWAELGSGS